MQTRESEQVRRAVRTAATRLPELFAPGTRFVVAFSGGQDSTCLLHALAHAHRAWDLLAVHVDHALRPDSADTATRVCELAERIGVPAAVARVDVPAYRASLARGASVQQAARAARYWLLAEAAARHAAAAVVVAHTADDQAETVLLNVVRGAGLLGLAGMRLDEALELRRLGPPLAGAPGACERVRVVRPLLRVPRSTTLAYCSQFGLTLVEDASNASRVYTRNRVRLDLLPRLAEFNPAIRTVLARTAELVADDLAALEGCVDELERGLWRADGCDLNAFRGLPRAIQRRLLRRRVARVGPGLADVPDAPIEDALDLLQTSEPNRTYDLPHGVELHVSRESFTLRYQPKIGGGLGPRV